MSYFATDNAGPPSSPAAVRAIYSKVRGVFPGAATVRASSFDEFAAEALTAEVVSSLPRTSVDWGDQWITGVSTDNKRMAVFREMARARAECIRDAVPECAREHPVMRNFTRWLAKNVEHTQGNAWGVDR